MRNRYVIRARISEVVFRRFLRHVAADLAAVQIAQLTGLNRNTVNRLLACLRFRMAEACESGSPLSGTIEVDESYFGPRRVRGKAGRGAGRKTPVFGIFKRDGKVYTELVPDCSKAVLQQAIRGKVSLDSVIHSDGWRGCDGLARLRRAGAATTGWWTWGARSTSQLPPSTPSVSAVHLPRAKEPAAESLRSSIGPFHGTEWHLSSSFLRMPVVSARVR